MPIEIHTKTGVETELTNIFEAWRALYPAKYRFFMSVLRGMRQVAKNGNGSYIDKKGRYVQVKFHVPQELWLFIQRRIPGFGRAYDDIERMLKIADEFRGAQHLTHKRIYSVQKEREKKNEDKRRNDRQKRGKDNKEDRGKSTPELNAYRAG